MGLGVAVAVCLVVGCPRCAAACLAPPPLGEPLDPGAAMPWCTAQGASRLDNIRAVYGAAVAKNAIPLSLTCGPGASLVPGSTDDELSCEVQVSL